MKVMEGINVSEHLDTFLTSLSALRHHVPDQKLATKPLSGRIFAVEVEVPGVPVAKFKG